jgi:predicted MPP superfamily phosphohydrolase
MEQTNSKRYVSLFEQSYEYSENHDTYKKLDAVVVCGDFTDEGLEGEYKIFNKITNENVRPETKMLVCMGNHEFIESRNDDSVDPFENYYKYVSENTETTNSPTADKEKG